jgi:acyl carrier protein
MMPARFIELEQLPFTPSGKVDRKLLETIELESGGQQETEYVEPQTEIQTRIADIWKSVLNTEKIGIHDNFFDIGGNSLGIIQVNLKLKEAFNRDIPALVMFEHSTIASMAAYLEQDTATSPASETNTREPDIAERTHTKSKGKNRMLQRKAKIRS